MLLDDLNLSLKLIKKLDKLPHETVSVMLEEPSDLLSYRVATNETEIAKTKEAMEQNEKYIEAKEILAAFRRGFAEATQTMRIETELAIKILRHHNNG